MREYLDRFAAENDRTETAPPVRRHYDQSHSFSRAILTIPS
jgi:hypothetical protein